MSTYNIIYQRDSTGWWVASVSEVPGCHTQGKSIDQARRRIREALGLFIKGAQRATLVDDICLPLEATRELEKINETRMRLEHDQAELQSTTLAAAERLTKTMGMSVRDAGAILGLSHQRIQQLVGKSSTARTFSRSQTMSKSIKTTARPVRK